MPRNFQPSDTASPKTRRRREILNYIDILLDETTACSEPEPTKLPALSGFKLYHFGKFQGKHFMVGGCEVSEEEGKGYAPSKYMAFVAKPRKISWEAKGESAIFLRGAEGEDGIWKDMVRALKKELPKFNDNGVFIEEGSREGASEEGETGEGVSGGKHLEKRVLEGKRQVIMSRSKGSAMTVL